MKSRVAISLGVAGIVGVLICVVGFAIAGGTEDRVSDYPAFEAGSYGEVDLEEGKQLGWFEADCFGCHGRESVFLAPELRIDGAEVTPYGDAREARYSEDRFLNYTDDGRDGGPAYEIAAPEAGAYPVHVGPSSEPGAVIRIGPSTQTRKIVGIAVVVAGFLLAGGVVIVLGAWGLSVLMRDATRQ